jgi:DNA-binding MarR family transcriptional regulator
MISGGGLGRPDQKRLHEQRGYERACRILLDAIDEPTARLRMDVEAIAAVVAGAKQARPALLAPKPTARPNGNGGDPDGAMGRGEIRVLKAIAQYPEGITHDQLAVLTGYKRTSRQTYVQRLHQRGYIEHRDQRMVVTEAGIAVLGSDFKPLPTSGKALRDHVRARLVGGERSILSYLIDIHPEASSPAAVGEATNYRRTSTGTYIQRLVARRLVVRQGHDVRASEILF